MDLKLKEKVVVVCGGAGEEGSIGRSIVNSLTNEGAFVAIVDKSERGDLLAANLNRMGYKVFFAKADVMDQEQMNKAFERIIQNFGRVDALVNNVGVNDGIGLEATYEQFMDSLRLNLASYWLAAKLACPELKKSGGSILNIGSKLGLTGQGGTSAYAAAKGGVLALTREWAVDLIAYGIRVNALVIAECWTPSYQDWIHTLSDGEEKLKAILDKIPFEKRMTSPQEIADTALFLLSEKSSHTTGQFVFVDGGYVHLDRALLPV